MAGRILQGVAKRRVAIWQAVAVAEVAKAQKTTPGIPPCKLAELRPGS